MQFEFPRFSIDERSLAAYCTVLEWADAHKVTITRTKIAKLLYLADLLATRNRDRPVTNIQWKWLDHGPFNHALIHAENELERSGCLERETVQYPSYSGTRLTLVHCDHEALDDDSREYLSRVFDAYASVTAGAIKDVTYRTAPMVAAQESGKRGDVLDLKLARPRIDLPALQARYRAVLSDAGENEPQEGDEAIVLALEDFSDERQRATRQLLDS